MFELKLVEVLVIVLNAGEPFFVVKKIGGHTTCTYQ